MFSDKVTGTWRIARFLMLATCSGPTHCRLIESEKLAENGW
jgi:hypothetical protein